MMRFIATLALVVLPFSAQAQQAWGDAGGCARVAGLAETTDLVFILWPDRIERWESTCTITGFDGDFDTRAVIETECSGEGETWVQTYGLTPIDDEVYAIWPVEAPDAIAELRLCK